MIIFNIDYSLLHPRGTQNSKGIDGYNKYLFVLIMKSKIQQIRYYYVILEKTNKNTQILNISHFYKYN